MVDIFKAAAHRYGTERRVLLLHGPVGSSKSTIARLGLEEYSEETDFDWTQVARRHESDNLRSSDDMPCPMHEEPLHLIPVEFQGLAELDRGQRLGMVLP